MTIWNIIKKDVRLLWPLALAVVISIAIQAAAVIGLGLSSDRDEQVFAFALSQIRAVMQFFFILLLVRQDSPVDISLDWLTRPLPRWKVLAAKLLSILLIVHVPGFLADVVIAYQHGYSTDLLFPTAFVNELSSFANYSLPVVVIASITETVAQAVLLGVGLGLSIPLIRYAAVFLLPDYFFGSISDDFIWVEVCLRGAVVGAGSLVILWLSFQRRKLVQARVGLGVVYALVLLLSFAPFSWMFAAQAQFADNQALGNAVQVEYAHGVSPSRAAWSKFGPIYRAPIRYSGLPAQSILNLNRAHLRLLDENGSVLYETSGKRKVSLSILESRPGFGMQVASNDTDIPATMVSKFGFGLPAAVAARLKGRSLRVAVDIYMTVLQRGPQLRVPTLFEHKYVEGIGMCSAREGTKEGQISLQCFPALHFSNCLATTAVGHTSSLHNMEQKACYSSASKPVWASAANRVGMGVTALNYILPLDNERSNMSPIAITDAGDTDFLIKVYQPKAYIHRYYETPLLNLDDL